MSNMYFWSRRKIASLLKISASLLKISVKEGTEWAGGLFAINVIAKNEVELTTLSVCAKCFIFACLLFVWLFKNKQKNPH